MNLIEHALTVYTEGQAAQADAADDHAEQQKTEFLKDARASARRTLSADAAELDWQYVPASTLPDHIEEARAILEPGRLEYLRYRMNYTNEDAPLSSFALVRPCLACGCDRIDEVTSLFHLGQILTETEPDHAEQAPASEGRAAAAVEAVYDRSRVLLGFVRRLFAAHPSAGLVLDRAVAFGFEPSSADAHLVFRAASAEAAKEIAAALGLTLEERIEPGFDVRRLQLRVTAQREIEGIGDVRVTGTTVLTDAEANAWHAEQNDAHDQGGES
jgi:hypothetical protein